MPQWKSTVDCLITMPDAVVRQVCISEDATGQQCLEKICSLLGTMECDYFGLRYQTAHGLTLWLNNRVKIKSQVKSKPYTFQFKVKYYVDPKMLQQPTTRHLFFSQVKAQLFDGHLPVKDPISARLGALLFQAELGDQDSYGHQEDGYPQCFREWDQGISRFIAKEHAKLKGLSRLVAEKQFLELAATLDHWGVCYTRVRQQQDTCFLGIGGHYIRLCNKEWKLIKRIPYQYLLEASFHNSTFNVTYQSANEANQTVQKSLALRCTHHRIARYLFRALTEDHTFFTHNTVSPRVRDHIRYKPWNHFCQHYLHLKTDTLYYFDVQRTLHEAYSYAWEILHQVNQQQMTLSISPSLQQSEQLDMDSTRQEESSSQHNQHSQQLQLGMGLDSNNDPFSDPPSGTSSHIDLAGYGLSKSSCDIAKELMESSSNIALSHSSTKVPHNESSTTADSRGDNTTGSKCKLSRQGTQKLKQLLQKIRDSRVCRVCMDSPVSAVFCPCGHHMACYKCALVCKTCPLCRHGIAYVQYVYSSGV